jgi:ATP-dependent RNA helicase SUPV3L1/SUV3
MAKKKKKLLKLNQAIRHYFGEDGFDEGIERVDEPTLIELAHSLGILPDAWDKQTLVRTFRRIWTEADIELRRHIVEFFRADGRVYHAATAREPAIERSEKIDAILREMDVTKEEALLLHNAFIDVRTKKINLQKMEAKLGHIRFARKKEELEQALQGHFDIEDRFEFNAALRYKVGESVFSKIQPLKTPVFSYAHLGETDNTVLIGEIEELKTALTRQKQEQLDAFLKTLEKKHPYFTDEELLTALRSAPPSGEIDAPPISDALLKKILHKSVPLLTLEQSEYDVVIGVQAELAAPYRSEPIPYELHLALERAPLMRALWRGDKLGIDALIDEEKRQHEVHFFRELEQLVEECAKAAAILELGDEELHARVYEFLIPQLHEGLMISQKSVRRVLHRFSDSIHQALLKRQRQQLLARTIRDFKNLFPLARELRRKLVLHIGPTNSGKTYTAMQALKKADTGYYLAPLRLLALEGYETLLKEGVDASLITGEEQIVSEEATHISSTIEMLNFDVDVDVCVIDEVQMIGDRDRGWAWANAIIGAPAKTVIMTGSSNARAAVAALADYLGEPLEVIEFERKNPLELMRHATPLADITPATAVVAFSRADVLRLKQQLSRHFRVSVVYGNLSPEVRREEARRFREGETEVLVATDAIAMGLNLPIQTILFSKADKFDGERQRLLTPSEIHQISGRAGRYGLKERGHVGALKPDVLQHLHQSFHKEAKEISIPFNVMANLEHIKLVGAILEEKELTEILQFFVKNMQFDGPFRAANIEGMLEASEVVDRYDLDLPTKFHLACAPLTMKSPYIVSAYERYIRSLERQSPVAYVPPTNLPDFAATMDELLEAEDRVKEISLYLWLSYRFPEFFIDAEKARQSRGTLNRFIENSLKQSHFVPRCRLCTKPLPLNSQYHICQSCFRKMNVQKRRAERGGDGESKPKKRVRR